MSTPCQRSGLQLDIMTISGCWVVIAKHMCMKMACSFHIVALRVLLLRKVNMYDILQKETSTVSLLTSYQTALSLPVIG